MCNHAAQCRRYRRPPSAPCIHRCGWPPSFWFSKPHASQPRALPSFIHLKPSPGSSQRHYTSPALPKLQCWVGDGLNVPWSRLISYSLSRLALSVLIFPPFITYHNGQQILRGLILSSNTPRSPIAPNKVSDSRPLVGGYSTSRTSWSTPTMPNLNIIQQAEQVHG